MTALFAALTLQGAAKPVADLPFDFVGNHVWVTATVGERPVHVVFDSGAGASAIDADVAVGSAKGREGHVYGNGSAITKAWQLKGVDLRLDGTDIRTPLEFALPLVNLTYDDKHPLEAIVGYDLLKAYVVEIDYPARRLRLYDPKSYNPPAGFSRVPIRLRSNIPTVDGTLTLSSDYARTVEATFAIDTGSAWAIDVTNRMVRREKLDRLGAVDKDVTAVAGLGGDATTRAIGPSSALLGNDLLGGEGRMVLSEKGARGRKADYDAAIGGAAFGSCDLVFDYSRSMLYLRSSIRTQPLSNPTPLVRQGPELGIELREIWPGQRYR